MGKIIKKSLKFLIIFAGILFMFPTLLYFALQIPAIQTGIVKRVTAHFSTQLQSTISIGRIEYRFFNKLYLRDILVKDKSNDTLLYASKLTAGVKRLDFKGQNFRIGRVSITDPVFALITDSAGHTNLNWFLDHLKKNPADTINGRGSNISVDRIDLGNASFALINRKPDSDTVTKNSARMIDFNNLRLDSINGIIEDLEIRKDSVNLTVYELAFREKKGMRVDRMSGSFMISGPEMLFRSVFIHTNTSILNLPELRMRGDSIEAFDNFTNKVKLDLLLDNSIIGSADLGYFVKLPDDFNEVVTLSGKIAGTISELRGRDIKMLYGKYTSLDCNFDLSGLPKIEDTYIYVGVNRLQTNAMDFENFRIPGKKKFEVPEVLYKLGNITFDGSFTGFTTDFVTYGEFVTELGELRTDISLRPDKSNVYLMKGLLNGNRINLGSLTDSKILGKLNIRANVDGSASSFKSFAGNLKGTVDSVEINNYTYRNIDLNGIFTDKTWDGSINVVDKNIKMDLLGMLNFKDSLPEFDFTLNLAHADLHKLNLDKKDTVSSVSMLITSNFRGNSIDNLDGEIKLLNSTITRNNKTIDLYDFSVRTFNENSTPVLSLRTDFVNADIRGKYNFAGLNSMVSSTLAAIMPSVFRPQKKKKTDAATNNFSFEINFRNTSEVSKFLNTGIVLADKSFIKGSVSPDTVINIQARAPFINISNIILNSFEFDAKSDGSVLNADMATSSLVLPGKTELEGFRFTFRTNPDNFIFNVDWDNKDAILERGNIRASGNVSESTAGSGNPVLKVDIDSTVIYTRNQPWHVNRSSVVIDTNAIKVNRIHIASEDRFYDIIGAVSHDPSDTLFLKFRGIDISPLNYLIQKNDTAALPLDLKGIINGGISLTNVYKDLLLQGSLIVNKFAILGSDFGDVSLNAGYNIAKKVVEINAGNSLGGKRMFDVNGYYDPEIKYINLDAVANKLPVEALNPLLKSFASGIKGTTSGKVKLSGPTNGLELAGAVKAENVSIKIDYLQTVYRLNDSVNFDSEGFRFNNVRFSDTEGHLATISGLVSHRNFKDYQADLTINMSNDFMVLNTTLANNPTFYGRVYGSGVTKIKTAPNLLSFDIVAKTGKNSKLSIPLNSSLSVSEYPFISFVNSNELKETTAKPSAQPTTLGLNINIDLNVTPEAVVELIFDPKVGDIMSGSGSGMLNITLNPKGDFAILGDYTLEQGSYLFTLGNILNKKFEVENGGKIMFNGNLDDAEIDLRTKYKKFNTSLFPIIQEQQYAQEKVAVEPQLILTGKLFNPTVNFEINLPNSNEQAKAYLRNGISSDEELSRQFLYLLVTQSFYSEQTSTTSGTSNPTGSSAVAATTFEMLSNQLSNWISQINENFNLGLSYKPGSGDRALNPDELNVAFETQVLDDRVLINGNFDYKTNSSIAESATRLTGDFDASVRITDRLRFKVFNRFNDTFLGIRGPYTQGIGIFYRQEFGSISDLLKKKGSMKKEEEPAVVVNK